MNVLGYPFRRARNRGLRPSVAAARRPPVPLIGVALVGVVGAIGLLLLLLGPVTWTVAGGTVGDLAGPDRAAAVNSVRQTVLAAAGGAAASIGLAFTVRNYYLGRRGQVTDRFVTAVGMLASEKLEERVGGVYAFDHVLNEPLADRPGVLGVLSAFIHAHPTADGETVGADVAAAVMILGWQPQDGSFVVDLRHCALAGLILPAWTKEGRVVRCWQFNRRMLDGMDLSRSNLSEVDFSGSWMRGVNLTDAIVIAYFDGTDLTGALLDGAQLESGFGLSAEQLSTTLITSRTVLPEGLRDDPWVIARIAECESWIGRGEQGAPPATPAP